MKKCLVCLCVLISLCFFPDKDRGQNSYALVKMADFELQECLAVGIISLPMQRSENGLRD